jgi:protoporphyrinogen oxidase
MDSLKQNEGLYLTGNAYYGVGVNDCVREAKRLAIELSKAINL